ECAVDGAVMRGDRDAERNAALERGDRGGGEAGEIGRRGRRMYGEREVAVAVGGERAAVLRQVGQSGNLDRHGVGGVLGQLREVADRDGDVAGAVFVDGAGRGGEDRGLRQRIDGERCI